MIRFAGWGRIAYLVQGVIVILGLSFGVDRDLSVLAQIHADQDECGGDPEFVPIPAGEFIAGSDQAERDYAYQISAVAAAASSDQIPQVEQRLRNVGWFDQEPPRRVEALPAFCLSRNLITNAEYQAFVSATGHRSPGISEIEYQDQGFLVHPYTKVQTFLWSEGQPPPGDDQHPVVLISIADIEAYMQWRGDRDQALYRLPTALEWEKAARGSEGRYFPWGDQWVSGATNAGDSDRQHTSPIGSFPLSRSPAGVEDMAGNVFEYTSTQIQRGSRSVVVMKGCSWDDLPGFCRSAYQHTRPPESRHILFGFRLVRESRSIP